MRTPILIILTALVGSCAAPPPPGPYAARQVSELAGRVAGPAQHCVDITPIDTIRSSETDPGTLIYGNGKTIWVNDLRACNFRRDDILITEPRGSRYCRGDIVRSMDRVSHIPGPACVLGDFVPYSRP
jgi:hypothetical protein